MSSSSTSSSPSFILARVCRYCELSILFYLVFVFPRIKIEKKKQIDFSFLQWRTPFSFRSQATGIQVGVNYIFVERCPLTMSIIL